MFGFSGDPAEKVEISQKYISKQLRLTTQNEVQQQNINLKTKYYLFAWLLI